MLVRSDFIFSVSGTERVTVEVQGQNLEYNLATFSAMQIQLKLAQKQPL